MFALLRKRLSISACAALAIFATGWPALADEALRNQGPVGPYEPILTTVGAKRVLAFYVPEKGGCAVSAVVWDKDENTGASPYSSSRVRLELNPGQVMKLDATGNESVGLKCGDDASTLTIGH
ncbi:MAG TPA: hypothetical protein VIG52_08205 [Methyloceanibacter sp.]|jgi:hypothetical protein